MRVQLMRRARQSEDGAVALMVAAMSVILIGVVAFVADLGLAYANQRNLQNGVDAATLALGQEIAIEADRDADCATAAAAFDTSAYAASASDWFDENVAIPSGSSSAEVTHFSVDCENVQGVEHVVVHAVGEQASPTFFGAIFGVEKLDISKEARVIVGPVGTVVGLRPFALCQSAANLVTGTPGSVFTFDFDNASTGCGYAPGNWGTLDFDGGSNAAGDLEEWTRVGYDGPISLSPPVYIPGDPGAPAPGKMPDAMNAMVAAGPVVLPVYDDLAGTGSGSEFRITGFVSVDVCGWKLDNKDGNDLSETTTCFAAPSPEPKNYIQVKFAKFIPVAELNLTCELGDSACDNGVRVAKLAD